MKRLALVLLIAAVLLVSGCTAADRWTETSYLGPLDVVGPVVIEGPVTIEGDTTVNGVTIPQNLDEYSIDIVQTYINGVSENDTTSLVFGFEPSKIVISYSAICHHENFPYEVGHTTGHSVINVTAVDTITVETNYTAIKDDDGVLDSAILHSHVNVLMAAGGYDGLTYARCWGIGTWETATHTLTVKFDDVQNTWEAASFFEIVATAYN